MLTLPLGLAVVDSLGPVLGVWPSALGSGTYQISAVFMACGLGVGVYGSFVYDVVGTICDYLDIWCLTIKHPWVEGGGGGGEEGEVGGVAESGFLGTGKRGHSG